MSCTDSIHVGDEGTVFEVTVTECVPDPDNEGETIESAVAVGTATSIEFRFLLPDGSLKVRTGSITTPSLGADGKVEYAAAAGDLSQAGNWKLQVRVGFSTGKWRTVAASFPVLSAIEALHYFDPTPAVATAGAPAVSVS